MVSTKRFFGRDTVAAGIASAGTTGSDSEKTGEKSSHPEKDYAGTPSDSLHGDDLARVPNPEVQGGVKKVEAITLTWKKNELILAYVLIFLVFFVVSMQQQIQFNLSYYVTSTFLALPLTGTTGILSSIIGGAIRLPTAKFIDLIGRAEGLLLMAAFTTIGLIMMAACRNVQTYAAAQVFYWVGFDGIGYVLDVFLADTSSLKNRALCFAFSTTPYIVTTFIGPRAAASFLKTSGWPWGYGTFAIVTPVIILPFLTLLYLNQWKARKNGLLKKEKSGRTLAQNVSFYFWEFDVIGLVIICAGFALFLLPFSLSTYQADGWGSGMIIAMLVIGILCLAFFGPYEKFLAKKSFIPFYLLKDPSVWGACFLSLFLFISFYLWDSYFYNYLQAVHNLSVANAGYVANIYSIGSCFWAVVYAGLIRILGRFKYLAMAHLCLQLLGTGLMIYFRSPGHSIGWVIMCQIFIAFSGGGLVISEQMAVMAAAPHENVASMLALIGLFTSFGNAVGTAIAGAIYTNKFPAALDRVLPGNATLNAQLYGSLPAQLSYAMGTPEREAVLYAYGDAMWYLTIVATAFLVPCFLFIAVWKDFKVKELKQVKGTVV